MKDLKFTQEIIATLENRVVEIIKAKYNDTIDYVKIEDGWVTGYYEDMCGDGYNHLITIEELNNSDLDILIAERLERERIQKEKEQAERLERERIQKERKEKEEYQTYLRLQEKYKGKKDE